MVEVLINCIYIQYMAWAADCKPETKTLPTHSF